MRKERQYYPRSSPDSVETEMGEHFVAKFGQVRVAAVAGIGQRVDDLGSDLRRALASHDDPTGKEQCFFHIVGHQ